jgi:hypothetical protein
VRKQQVSLVSRHGGSSQSLHGQASHRILLSAGAQVENLSSSSRPAGGLGVQTRRAVHNKTAHVGAGAAS